jgi:hypothetical protein
MKKHLFALLALGIVGSAMAQTPPPAAGNVVSAIQGVATEIDATGNVLRNLRVGDTLGAGSTVSTTGTLTVNGGGCSANLGTGQSMLMSATSVCDASRLAQQPGQQAPGGGGGTSFAGGGGGGVGGGGFFSSSGFLGLGPLGLGAAGLGTLGLGTAVAQNARGGTPAPISNN